MTTKEMSDFLNSLWCWARCTEEEQRKLSEIADYLSNQGNEKNDGIKITLEDVKRYCEPRCQTIISNKLLYELTHPKIKALKQETQSFKWCTDCKEYDQEKHCCHRWSKVIRDTVEEMKQESVIDKIRAEIEEYKSRQLALAIGVEDLEEGKQIALEYVLAILDKYKADVEPQEVRNKWID
jgi:hypothetical protein